MFIDRADTNRADENARPPLVGPYLLDREQRSITWPFLQLHPLTGV